MKLHLNKNYLTGLTATTELHAGGIFFSIVYKKCLRFEEEGVVNLTFKIYDKSRAMDQYDIDNVANYNQTGKYYFNNRGYLECSFENGKMIYTGLQTIINDLVLVFHVQDKLQEIFLNEVFELEVTPQ